MTSKTDFVEYMRVWMKGDEGYVRIEVEGSAQPVRRSRVTSKLARLHVNLMSAYPTLYL